MGFFMRGALIEYSGEFLGPIPNVVIFQFNPETLQRTIQIPPRPTSAKTPAASAESAQAGAPSIEKITLKASFSAMDELGDNKVLARAFGVGTRLAALEKMVRPAGALGGLLGAALNAIGDALGGGGDEEARAASPRPEYPRILFIWGPFRILPVIIESMSITEQHYDFLLNPIQAEVSITMAVNEIDAASTDTIGKGALDYSNLAKDAQAIVNLANTVEQVAEIIPF
jgi:hypothetical protein